MKRTTKAQGTAKRTSDRPEPKKPDTSTRPSGVVAVTAKDVEAAKARESTKTKSEPPAKPKGREARSARTPGVRESIYLASQLASICDVDLKTIHNWCERDTRPGAPAELESFRTPGKHLRFRQGAVLKFLNRWGYPIPDALLTDRLHLMIVEPDLARRTTLVSAMGLRRPGEEPLKGKEATKGPPSVQRQSVPPPAADPTLGLFAHDRWYVHVWDDPYAALVAAGERAGAGAPPDLAVLRLPMDELTEVAWLRALRERPATQSIRFAFMIDAGTEPGVGAEMGVVGAVASDDFRGLDRLLEEQADLLGGDVTIKPTGRFEGSIARKARVKIPPREPIYVASQVAHIWDVDLKTVHNWVERGDIEAFCTPGRHLRFRRRSLLNFLRRYNMAIPAEVAPLRPRVVVIDENISAARTLAGVLSSSFEVLVSSDPVAALAEIGTQCAGANMIDAVVVTLPAKHINDVRWLTALSQHPDTRYTRVVAVARGVDASQQRSWQNAGAMATVTPDDHEQIGVLLERTLGLST